MSLLNKLRLVWKIPFLERILLSFTVGKEFGKMVTKFPPNHYQYRKGTFRQTKRDGINYKLDLSDLVDWYIYFGFKEPSRMDLYNLIEEGQTVFDIGANVGDITMHIAQKIGDRGVIHSFEPDPINYKRISKNISLNTFKNIHLNNMGLGSETAKLKIIVRDEYNRGMNQLVKGSVKEGDDFIQIMRFDDYVKKNGINKIDVIKIDVEGFDFEVLKGASDTLDKFHPKLFIELDDDCLIKQDASATQLVTFLEKKGYKITNVDTKKLINSSMDFSKCHYDIIAE